MSKGYGVQQARSGCSEALLSRWREMLGVSLKRMSVSGDLACAEQ